MADISHGTYFPAVQTDAVTATTVTATTLNATTLTADAFTAGSLTVGAGAAAGSPVKVSKHTLTAAADGKLSLDGGTAAATVGWTNPEGAAIAVLQVLVNNPAATAAATDLNIGTTAVSAATASDNIIDGLDCKASTGLIDSLDATMKGTSGLARALSLADGKWITATDAGSGDVTGLAVDVYIVYAVL